MQPTARLRSADALRRTREATHPVMHLHSLQATGELQPAVALHVRKPQERCTVEFHGSPASLSPGRRVCQRIHPQTSDLSRTRQRTSDSEQNQLTSAKA